jgi:Predicted glutamine amidotransferases
VAETLGVVDGLVFSGGSDLDPSLYGAPVHDETAGVVRERDEFELSLMEAALAADVPLLAICRGSQVLNVARGGGIEQHLPEVLGHSGHRERAGAFSSHDVAVSGGTRLSSIVGEAVDVKSHHHQGYGSLGAGLVATASAPDGTVEALEDPSRRFALGVLWHPRKATTSRSSKRCRGSRGLPRVAFGHGRARLVLCSEQGDKSVKSLEARIGAS